MSVHTPTRVSSLYDRDFAEWLDVSIGLLPDQRFDELDLEHLIEEVQRAEITNRLERSPSLRRGIVRSVERMYSDALAIIETGLPPATLPSEGPFTPAQVLDTGFLPD